MVTVTVDISKEVADLGGLSKEMIREGLKKTSQDLIRNLQIKSPYQHGLLKQWAVTSQTDTEIEIRSPAYYAGWVNDGHPQQPGRFIPGEWKGEGRFEYKKGAKTGMVLKESYVPGKHFVEASIRATQPRIKEFFTIKG